MSDRALRQFERRIGVRLAVTVAVRRVWESMPAILQIIAAVAAAYSAAHWGLGHAFPIMAVTVTINSLGFARDARPARVAVTVLGILTGVALSDGLSIVLGKGLWQLVVVLLVVFVIGRAVTGNPAFAIAAAVPSAIVLILPVPDGGVFGRTFDAAIGAVVALLVTALIPRSPGRAAARDRRQLFATVEEAMASIVDALRDADEAAGELGLTRLRRTQPLVDAWSESLDSALAVARISPLLRSRLPDLHRSSRAFTAADLATRHLRIIARRVSFLVRDGVPRPALADVIAQFATGFHLLGEELDDPLVAGASRSLLTDLARNLSPADVLPNAAVVDVALLLMLRPFAIDLLTGSGMQADEARALLPPV